MIKWSERCKNSDVLTYSKPQITREVALVLFAGVNNAWIFDAVICFQIKVNWRVELSIQEMLQRSRSGASFRMLRQTPMQSFPSSYVKKVKLRQLYP
jgi:hypothetical protein